MPIGRKNQGEGDDNNVSGTIGSYKDRRAKDDRAFNRRNKLEQTKGSKATNKDGNKKTR